MFEVQWYITAVISQVVVTVKLVVAWMNLVISISMTSPLSLVNFQSTII